MHIVFITPGFAKDESDSYTIPPLQALAYDMANHNIKVSVIALDYPKVKSHYPWKNLDVYSCGGNNTGWPLKLFTLIKAFSIFRKIHSENPVSLLHSFWWQETALLGNLLSKKYAIPHITTLMGQDALPANRYAHWLSARNRIMITLSHFHERNFVKTFGRRSDKIIHWGIDETDFDGLQPTNRDIDIIGVGWLNEVKNFEEFIGIVSEVRKVHSTLNCVIVGEGKNRKQLEDKVASLQLQESIRFTGLLPRRETLQMMMRSKVLLHTSKFEGCGYVFVEALLAGAKIVSHEVGIADSSNALIGSSVREMAENVIRVLNTEKEFKTQLVWSIEQTTQEYLQLYKKLLPA